MQKALGTKEASLLSLKAGMDMLCIGNNLINEEQAMPDIAAHIEQHLPNKENSIARVRKRKDLLKTELR